MSELELIFDFFGLVGGFILSLALVPQVIRVFRTGSARDLSYFWQAIALTGLTCLTIYGFGKNLWPIYASVLIEIFLVLVLIVLKIYFDHCGRNEQGEIETIEVDDEVGVVVKAEVGDKMSAGNKEEASLQV